MNYRNIATVLILTLILFITMPACLATEIKGHIFDKETKEPLIGATVQIQGTTIGAIADVKGYYIISFVKPGKYKLVASYIGYEAVELEIVVPVGGVLFQDFYLTYGSNEIEGVVISVQAEGQIKAINQQINADAILNVISAKRIQEVPDGNAAESVKRLPGISLTRSNGEGDQIVIRGLQPKYNLVSVNGNRAPSTDADNNSVGLAGISPYMLAGIEVQKTLTPDKEADVIGGIVNLKLRDAPQGFKVNIIYENVFNTLRKANNFNPKATFVVSNRFFNNKLGILGQINYEKLHRPNDQLTGGDNNNQAKPDSSGKYPQQAKSANFSCQELTRERFGGSIFVDYKLTNGKITANIFVNGLNDDWFTRQHYSGRVPPAINNTNKYGYSNSISNMNSVNFENTLFLNSKFDMGLTYNTATRSMPKERTFITSFQDLTSISTSKPLYDTPVYGLLTQENQLNDSSLFIREISDKSEKFYETEKGVQFNWEFPVIITNQINGYLKIGGKYRAKTRKNEVENRGISLIDGAGWPIRDTIPYLNPDIDFDRRVAQNLAALPIMDNDYSPLVLDGQVQMHSFLRQDYMDQILDNLDRINWMNNPYAINNMTNVKSDYEGNEQYTAAYIMTNLNLFKYLNIVGGVRYEKMITDITSYGVFDKGQGAFELKSLSNKKENSYFLPMINLKFKPLEWFDLRLSYTQSIARPSYFNFMPRYEKSNMGNYITFGNVDLNPALSHNYDAYISFYSNKIGLITIGGFYKEIEGFEYYKSLPAEKDTIIQFYNVDMKKGQFINCNVNNPYTSIVKGIELDWQGTFRYLPKPFNGLVINVNYTRMFSSSNYYVPSITPIYQIIRGRKVQVGQTVNDSSFSAPLLQQPNDLFNASLGYDYKGFSSRIAYNFQGYTLSWSNGIRNLDTYKQKYATWDLSIRQKLPWYGIQLMFSINNLTSAFNQEYQEINGIKYPTSEDYYGTAYTLGIRCEL